jgi:hypothetical protein
VRRSNAVLDRAVCFLGRFLPKLGGPTRVAIFLAIAPRAWPRRARMARTTALASALQDRARLFSQSHNKSGNVLLYRLKGRQSLDAALIHVQIAGDFDL